MGQLVIKISDLAVAVPPDTLITYALGSCVGICLFDAAARVGGMAHIMLPDSKTSVGDANIAKFADTALPYLVTQMGHKGAAKARLKAKIAGGAQMFGSGGGAARGNDSIWHIGQRNVTAVIEVLQRLGIPIVAKDVLSNYGRTVSFDPSTGIMTVKSLNNTVKEL